MKIGEIKEFNVDGKYIRVEYVGENLYAINDVLVCVDLNNGYDLFNPEHLVGFIEAKDDPYFPYPGADEGFVMGISPSAVNKDVFIESLWDFDTFDHSVQMRAIDSLRHYRQMLHREKL